MIVAVVSDTHRKMTTITQLTRLSRKVGQLFLLTTYQISSASLLLFLFIC